MPTIDELRARRSEPAPRPRKTVTVTLVEGQHIVANLERLTQELEDLVAAGHPVDEDGKRLGPRKSAESDLPPEVEEKKQQILTEAARLPEVQGELTLLAEADPGAWQLFKTANPPRIIGHHETRRENGDVIRGNPIYDPTDMTLGRGWCDTVALGERLGRYVAEWNGEAVNPGEWDDWLAARILLADHRELIGHVIDLHENGVQRAPKSLTGSSTTQPG